MPDVIILRPFYHKNNEQIGLEFHNEEFTKAVRKIKGIGWSRLNSCWYLPLTQENYLKIKNDLEGLAVIDTTVLKSYLDQRKVYLKISGNKFLPKASYDLIMRYPLNETNLEAFDSFRNMLDLKGYSRNTIRVYCGEFHQLLRLLSGRSVNDLTREHLNSYLLYLMKKRKYSETHVHTTVNALKFYFEQVLKKEKEYYDLPRPKKKDMLPTVLSEQEITRLLKQTNNLKHRCLMMTAYAAGLRVSELVNLKLRDIDSERMMIHVRQGKGKKDRMVPLSGRLLSTLREYFKEYRPKEYLFEGEKGGPYTTRSAQAVLAQAKERAGIKKSGSMHSLRHSYATHLLEQGTDIRYIQEFLGHKNISTTTIYTHVSKLKMDRFKSPLDNLDI